MNTLVDVDKAVVREHLRPVEGVVLRRIDAENSEVTGTHLTVEMRMQRDQCERDREIAIANKAMDKEKRRAHLRLLSAEHKDYIGRMLKRVEACDTRASLYVLLSQAEEHDKDMCLRAGRVFCNTREELAFAFEHRDLVITERIKKEQARPVYASFPANAKAVRLEKGDVVVMAINDSEMSYWVKQGFMVTAIAR